MVRHCALCRNNVFEMLYVENFVPRCRRDSNALPNVSVVSTKQAICCQTLVSATIVHTAHYVSKAEDKPGKIVTSMGEASFNLHLPSFPRWKGPGF